MSMVSIKSDVHAFVGNCRNAVVDQQSGLMRVCRKHSQVIVPVEVQTSPETEDESRYVVVPEEVLFDHVDGSRYIDGARCEPIAEDDSCLLLLGASIPNAPTHSVTVAINAADLLKMAKALHDNERNTELFLQIPISLRDSQTGEVIEAGVDVSSVGPIAVIANGSKLRAVGTYFNDVQNYDDSPYDRLTQIRNEFLPDCAKYRLNELREGIEQPTA